MIFCILLAMIFFVFWHCVRCVVLFSFPSPLCFHSLFCIWFWVLVGLDFCPFQVEGSPPSFGKGALVSSLVFVPFSFPLLRV